MRRKVFFLIVIAIGIAAFIITVLPVRKAVFRASANMTGRRKEIASLFRVPLVASAALLSFAHGSNDVANAIGPLAAIVSGINSDSKLNKRFACRPRFCVHGQLSKDDVKPGLDNLFFRLFYNCFGGEKTTSLIYAWQQLGDLHPVRWDFDQHE